MEIQVMSLDKSLTKTYTFSQARKTEYPSIAEQLDLLWHAIDEGKFGDTAKTSSFYTTLKAVKDKYPSS